MEFRDITAVSGMPGLQEMVNARQDGMIIRHLDNKKTQFVSNRIHTFSPLDKIAIYTDNDSVPLIDVMLTIKEQEANGLKIPGTKDSSANLKSFFRKILADFDEERVYVSDIKKVIKWYAILQEHDLIHPIPEEVEEEETEKSEEVVTDSKEK